MLLFSNSFRVVIMKKLLFLLLIIGQSLAAETIPSHHCFDHGWNIEKLTELKKNKFDADKEVIDQLTKQLRYCLAVKDPDVRDGIAYEAYFSWLRSDKITGDSLKNLFDQFSNELEGKVTDTNGVYLPFVALVYAEIVRVDRVTPYLTGEERLRAVKVITDYMSGISDYRGFDEEVGYRHAIAHSADVILQLALNKNITQSQLKELAGSIASQINPKSGHFYRYGEPERIARAIGYSMLREELGVEFWHNWLHDVASPLPFEAWEMVFKNDKGLAKRNNTRQFLTNLYAMIAVSEHPRLVKLAPIVRQLITNTG